MRSKIATLIRRAFLENSWRQTSSEHLAHLDRYWFIPKASNPPNHSYKEQYKSILRMLNKEGIKMSITSTYRLTPRFFWDVDRTVRIDLDFDREGYGVCLTVPRTKWVLELEREGIDSSDIQEPYSL